jgi:hypothetical protein
MWILSAQPNKLIYCYSAPGPFSNKKETDIIKRQLVIPIIIGEKNSIILKPRFDYESAREYMRLRPAGLTKVSDIEKKANSLEHTRFALFATHALSTITEDLATAFTDQAYQDPEFMDALAKNNKTIEDYFRMQVDRWADVQIAATVNYLNFYTQSARRFPPDDAFYLMRFIEPLIPEPEKN